MESWSLSINELHNSPMLTKELLKVFSKYLWQLENGDKIPSS